MNDNKDRSGFLERLQLGWQQTVGSYATDEGETKNLLSRLVEFGHLSREESVREFVQMRSKIEENRRELDARVDASVKAATSKLRVNSRGELEELSTQLSKLETRMATLENDT